MKNIWIIANWKSNKSVEQALEWVSIVGPKLKKKENVKLVVCPSFSSLFEVKKAISEGDYPLLVGCQNLSPFGEGAYTGEEAASILKNYVDLAILGHSERRQNFTETDELVAKKVLQAAEQNIIPLVCVQNSNTPIPPRTKIVAYEPVFAIGTGNPDTPENAEAVAKKIREKITQDLQQNLNSDLEIIYGGSVTSENIKSFVGQTNISGVLPGKASLDAEEFIKIVEVCQGI